MTHFQYKNPILHSDFSDPDVIRHGDFFYMISSSFNFLPGLPVLRSKNLVQWELVNYIVQDLPFEEFSTVQAGKGVWAPSIRFHNGLFYCFVPIYGKGIYVSTAENPEGLWSPLHCLVENPGVIDPCPLWTNDEAFLVVGFAKSQCGFNSVLGLYKMAKDASCVLGDYSIIYDGHFKNPTIEGPKFYEKNGYYYIMAPAGSVKSGWQTCLRSKNITGPYEERIVMMQGDTVINGPHQGALVDTPNGDWYFLHFQDKGPYGRVVHLQPVSWIDDWPLCGTIKEKDLPGNPVTQGIFPVSVENPQIDYTDDFSENSLSLLWQTSANRQSHWYQLSKGLQLSCLFSEETCVEKLPNIFTTMFPYENFMAEIQLDSSFLAEDERLSFVILGTRSALLSVKKIKDAFVLQYSETFEQEEKVIREQLLDSPSCTLGVSVMYREKNRAMCEFFLDGEKLAIAPYEASPGRWVGTRIGFFAQGKSGFGKIMHFSAKKILQTTKL